MRRTGQSSAEFEEVRQTSHYPAVEWPVIGMSKMFGARTRTGLHCHDRGQLLSVRQGFAVACTTVGTWLVPQGHALWIPPGVRHDVSMHSDVRMQTAYVSRDAARELGSCCATFEVGALLEAGLIQLAAETDARSWTKRADHLAWLIVDEIGRARATPLVLPMPDDFRLRRLLNALVDDPGSDRTIDQWCDVVGLSRRSMTRLFRAQTGLSFGGWRRRLRLVTAISRIADGESPARVSASLGYRNPAAFKAMLKRYIEDGSPV